MLIESIKTVWSLGKLDHAIALSKMAIKIDKLPRTFQICEYAAMLDGEWYFGEADEYPSNNGIRRYDWIRPKPIDAVNLSDEAKQLAKTIYENAKAQYNCWEAAYDHWEASWIDGPENFCYYDDYEDEDEFAVVTFEDGEKVWYYHCPNDCDWYNMETGHGQVQTVEYVKEIPNDIQEFDDELKRLWNMWTKK